MLKKKTPLILHQVSNFASGLGNSILMITIPWLILQETRSPAFAGLVAAISAIPGLIISPIGGWLVDHVGRRALAYAQIYFHRLQFSPFQLWL